MLSNLYHICILGLRRIYAKVFATQTLKKEIINNPDTVSEIITNGINSGRPFMVSRFGAVEITSVSNYLGVKGKCHNPIKVICGKSPEWWWNEGNRYCMKNNAGFFSNDDHNLSRFGEMMLSDMQEIDVLLSWQSAERHFVDQLKHSVSVGFIWVDPFWSKTPWTKSLEGKNVLVIHPFAEEIQYQYQKRDLIHANPDILPEFNLITLKAVQSIGGNNEFETWFDALEYMERQIDNIDFDVCLLGCGAYGMPLAAYVKRMGKIAIHFGGSLQLLFGIKGRRWETSNYGCDYFSDGIGRYPELINENWIRPFETSKFKGAEKVENGCYW